MITPLQQVDVLRKIFEDGEVFSEENLSLMKDVMRMESEGSSVAVYGKTGSGIKDDSWADAWFVGMFEANGDTIYFAVRLNDPESRGSDAKEVAIDIINGAFGSH